MRYVLLRTMGHVSRHEGHAGGRVTHEGLHDRLWRIHRRRRRMQIDYTASSDFVGIALVAHSNTRRKGSVRVRRGVRRGCLRYRRETSLNWMEGWWSTAHRVGRGGSLRYRCMYLCLRRFMQDRTMVLLMFRAGTGSRVVRRRCVASTGLL